MQRHIITMFNLWLICFMLFLRRIRAAVARFSRHRVDALLFKSQGDVLLAHNKPTGLYKYALRDWGPA